MVSIVVLHGNLMRMWGRYSMQLWATWQYYIMFIDMALSANSDAHVDVSCEPGCEVTRRFLACDLTRMHCSMFIPQPCDCSWSHFGVPYRAYGCGHKPHRPLKCVMDERPIVPMVWESYTWYRMKIGLSPRHPMLLSPRGWMTSDLLASSSRQSTVCSGEPWFVMNYSSESSNVSIEIQNSPGFKSQHA